MHAKTIIGINQEYIQVALKESLSDGDKPTLPIVFTVKQEREVVCSILHVALKEK